MSENRTIVHVLSTPRAEGCPRLSLDLIHAQREVDGVRTIVLFLQKDPPELWEEFERAADEIGIIGPWRVKRFAQVFLTSLKELRRCRPKGIICFPIGPHVPLGVAARILRIPVVLHIGNSPPSDSGARRKLRLTLKAGEPLVRKHLACSEFVAGASRNAYGLRKVEAVPNGVVLDRLLALRSSRVKPSESRILRIGMVATLSSHKDQAVLVQAAAALKSRGIAFTMSFAGDGPEREKLERLTRDLGLESHVQWRGTVADVASFLQQLDIFAFATTESEGQGIALLEAMAVGLPVVASDVSACKEVLEGGRWGKLVQARDPELWADALEEARTWGETPVEAVEPYDVRQTWKRYREALFNEIKGDHDVRKLKQ